MMAPKLDQVLTKFPMAESIQNKGHLCIPFYIRRAFKIILGILSYFQ